MKRIVFNLDDTLIPWEDRNWCSVEDALIQLNYDFDLEDLQIIKNSVKEYEKLYYSYDRDTLSILIEKNLGKSIPYNFIDAWFNNLACYVPDKRDYELIKMLEGLRESYSLYVFTNFFKTSQIGRLKRAGLYPFFERIISADEHLIKPYSDGFVVSCYGLNPEECLMVGDTYETDIIGAESVGMKTLLLDAKNRYPDYKGDKIKKIGEIVNYL